MCSSMDPVATTVATWLASSVVAMAKSVEHGDGRSGRKKNGGGGGLPLSI